MRDLLISLLAGLASTLRTRASLQVEILALRHQLSVLQRGSRRRLRLQASDRVLWVVLSILYVFIILAHERRRVVHFNVTEHPTADWTAAQLMQAFPWDTAPRYLLRDRDRIFGDAFRKQAGSMEIAEVLTAPRSPWHSPYVERLMARFAANAWIM